MPSMYARGRAFEYKVRDKLEELGFAVFRIAGSKPIDLIALSQRGEVFLIECKKGGHITKREVDEMQEFAKKYKANYIVVTPEGLKNLPAILQRTPDPTPL